LSPAHRHDAVDHLRRSFVEVTRELAIPAGKPAVSRSVELVNQRRLLPVESH
jgi:hypothetical protein